MPTSSPYKNFFIMNHRGFCQDCQIQQECLQVFLVRLQLATYFNEVQLDLWFILYEPLLLQLVNSLYLELKTSRFLGRCFQGSCSIVHHRHIGLELLLNRRESSRLEICQYKTKELDLYEEKWEEFTSKRVREAL